MMQTIVLPLEIIDHIALHSDLFNAVILRSKYAAKKISKKTKDPWHIFCQNGLLGDIAWLNKNKIGRCTRKALDASLLNNHFVIFKYLMKVRNAKPSPGLLNMAVLDSNTRLIEFLFYNAFGYADVNDAIQSAILLLKVDILVMLMTKCTQYNIDIYNDLHYYDVKMLKILFDILNEEQRHVMCLVSYMQTNKNFVKFIESNIL